MKSRSIWLILVVLMGIVPLLAACGVAAPLAPAMFSTLVFDSDSVKIPHTLEGRNKYCLLHHEVAGVPVGDVASIAQSGGIVVSSPERETHDGLPNISCSGCHEPSWVVGRTTGILEVGVEEDCTLCHDQTP